MGGSMTPMKLEPDDSNYNNESEEKQMEIRTQKQNLHVNLQFEEVEPNESTENLEETPQPPTPLIEEESLEEPEPTPLERSLNESIQDQQQDLDPNDEPDDELDLDIPKRQATFRDDEKPNLDELQTVEQQTDQP